MTVGSEIKSIRKHNNLTQQEFSEKICVSRSFVSKIENGKEQPSGTLIRLISYAFNVDEKKLIK